MSDFESGLATKVRLLPGEQVRRSGTVSASDGAAAKGAKCARRGAHLVSGPLETASVRMYLTAASALLPDMTTKTTTKTTATSTGTCGHMGCTAQHDGAPWMFGIKLCWTHRLMLAGRRG